MSIDTGNKNIKSIVYGNAFKCQIHALKLDNTLLCNSKLKDNPIHAGYDIKYVSCKKCLKKLNRCLKHFGIRG